MAWSWSHTNEAYTAAEYNLCQLDRGELEVIFAEWRAAQGRHNTFESHWFDGRRYERALAWAKTRDALELIDFIWEKASEYATCDNGGWNCWLCPSGCHTVPFDFPDGVDIDDASEFLSCR